jgi:hypothetical protein
VKRIVLLAGAVAALVPLASHPAWACSGCERPRTIQKAADAADVVFVGIAEKTRGASTPFEPIVVYKNTSGISPNTITYGACWGGPTFRAGKTYTVFAYESNGVLATGCTYTQLGVVPPRKLRLAPQPLDGTPLTARDAPSGESFFSGPIFWILFRIAAALAVPVFIVIWTRLRARRA